MALEIKSLELISLLDEKLNSEFTGEEFHLEELAAVNQALVNSMRASRLRAHRAGALVKTREGSGPFPVRVQVLEVREDLSSQWMPREEIIDEIEDTSGLERRAAEYALDVVADKLRQELKDKRAIASVEHIGEFHWEKSESSHHGYLGGLYSITLAEELQVPLRPAALIAAR